MPSRRAAAAGPPELAPTAPDAEAAVCALEAPAAEGAAEPAGCATVPAAAAEDAFGFNTRRTSFLRGGGMAADVSAEGTADDMAAEGRGALCDERESRAQRRLASCDPRARIGEREQRAASTTGQTGQANTHKRMSTADRTPHSARRPTHAEASVGPAAGTVGRDATRQACRHDAAMRRAPRQSRPVPSALPRAGRAGCIARKAGETRLAFRFLSFDSAALRTTSTHNNHSECVSCYCSCKNAKKNGVPRLHPPEITKKR